MRALAFILALGALGLQVAPAFASPAALSTELDTTLNRWQQAQRALDATRATQTSLEQRIGSLKRQDPRAPALESLLRASLEADRVLAAQEAEIKRHEQALGQLVRRGVVEIDSEIRSTLPRLKTGPLADRKVAAQTINSLRALRDRLRGALAQVTRGDEQRAWARYSVKIEPLDGPTELNEKADVVEDTRDKLAQRRTVLAQLLREAKEEREIAVAAADFSTDVSLFDEETRTSRVLRQAGGNDGRLAATAAKDTTVGNAAPAPEQLSGFQDRNEAVDPAVPTTPVAPSVAAPQSVAVAKDINASVLLSARVEDLAAQRLDLATLEQLVAELARLDAYLAAEANKIRQRASALEADEAKTR